MSGNRWPDVCALCDRAIDPRGRGTAAKHLFLGAGWVHGGGREHIPVHHGCAWLGELAGDEPVFASIVKNVFGWLWRREAQTRSDQ